MRVSEIANTSTSIPETQNSIPVTTICLQTTKFAIVHRPKVFRMILLQFFIFFIFCALIGVTEQ